MTPPLDDDELRAAYAPHLRQGAPARGPDCPSPDALLAALRGERSEPERLRVLDHALQCSACRPELALLHAVSSDTPVEASRSRPLWRRLVPLAVAASIVLAVGIAGLGQLRDRQSQDITRAGGDSGPGLISPGGGEAIPRGPVSFVWHPGDGALGYTLELNASDGTLIYSVRTADTAVNAALDTIAAGRHRWWIRAHLNDGSEQRSETRILEVR